MHLFAEKHIIWFTYSLIDFQISNISFFPQRPICPKQQSFYYVLFKGSDSENSDGAPWRGSGGSVNVARRSLASGSRPTTPIMSPILNRSSSGSRIGAFHRESLISLQLLPNLEDFLC